jgi:hypothetical protein
MNQDLQTLCALTFQKRGTDDDDGNEAPATADKRDKPLYGSRCFNDEKRGILGEHVE